MQIDPSHLKYLREEFYKLIHEKTGWGRNEIMINFDKAIAAFLIRIMESKEV
jgi:hypothetical protein